MQQTQCVNCEETISGKYCSQCGQATGTKRITLSSLLHEVVHTFTHLDKGYGYTLKQLVRQPGDMQREYLQGKRSRHQKPFSYFFINATACALISYWISLWVAAIYGITNVEEGNFFRHYFAITQVILLPFYALVSWSVWKVVLKAGYNYGEMIVLILYSAGTFLLFICFIGALKIFFPDLNTRYLEVPLLITYNIITNMNFFDTKKRMAILLGTVFTFGINYFVSNFVGELVRTFFH